MTQAHPAAVAPAAPRSTGDCAPRSATHRPTPCIYPRSSPPLLRPPRRRRGQPRPARAARLQKRPRRFRKWPAIRRRGSGGSGRRSAAEAAAVPRPSLRPVRFRFGSEGRGGVAACRRRLAHVSSVSAGSSLRSPCRPPSSRHHRASPGGDGGAEAQAAVGVAGDVGDVQSATDGRPGDSAADAASAAAC